MPGLYVQVCLTLTFPELLKPCSSFQKSDATLKASLLVTFTYLRSEMVVEPSRQQQIPVYYLHNISLLADIWSLLAVLTAFLGIILGTVLGIVLAFLAFLLLALLILLGVVVAVTVTIVAVIFAPVAPVFVVVVVAAIFAVAAATALVADTTKHLTVQGQSSFQKEF